MYRPSERLWGVLMNSSLMNVRVSLFGCIALALVVSGCGGGGHTSIDSLVEATCAGAAIDRSPTTWFADAEAYCPDGRDITWFASAEDKASFMEIGTAAAESFGVPFTVIDEGPRYVVLRLG